MNLLFVTYMVEVKLIVIDTFEFRCRDMSTVMALFAVYAISGFSWGNKIEYFSKEKSS